MPTTVDATIGTGGGYDYSSLAAWESGTQGNLVAADEIRRGVISQASYHETLSSAFSISGATTDATRYRVLTVAASCSVFDNTANPLRWDTTKGAAVSGGTASYTDWFGADENYCVVERLQYRNQKSRGMSTGAATAKIRKCLIYAADGISADTMLGTAETCVIIQGADSVATDLRTGGVLLNCTIAVPTGITYTSQLVYRAAYQSGTITNCALFASGQAALSSSFTFTNCYTDRASPPSGCTNVAYDTSTGSGFEAISSGSEDYRIKSTSALVDTGTATGAPAADIFGRSWGASVEVGACAYVASSAVPSITAVYADSITTTSVVPRVTLDYA